MTARDDALDLLRADGAAPAVVASFAQQYDRLAGGESGVIAEADLEPLADLPRLEDLPAAPDGGLATTAAITLAGGLGTSMGLSGPKSLLPVKDGLTFLDLTVRQVLAARARHAVPLPLLLMTSYRTHDSTAAALAAYPALPVPEVPTYLRQSRVPKLTLDGLRPVRWPADPELEWCPPGHGDLYPSLWSSGVLAGLRAAGYRYAFCSNVDNLGAVPDARIPAWMADQDIPFVVESCRRTPADRKGGHVATRRSDGRLILRDTAQTSPGDLDALQDLDRHRYCSTNNIWIDLDRLAEVLDAAQGVLGLPLIRNVKTVDAADPSSPRVVQAETAMGAAVQCFAGARSVLVPRERFVPVKTTNDLLVLRSDRYRVDDEARVVRTTDTADPFVDLDPARYAHLDGFDRRFPAGPPSLKDAERFTVRGDVTFGAGVVVRGDVRVEREQPDTVADTELVG